MKNRIHMKKIIMLIATALVFGLALIACRKNDPAMPDKSTGKQGMDAATYVCPMHPEVTDTKASKCPKCGMSLVKKI